LQQIQQQQPRVASPDTSLRPTLVRTRKKERRSPLALWHLASLDAPTVAALWTYFVARCAGLTLPWTAPTAMFVAVWMIYAADRLLDARDLSAANLEARHRFHHRYRSRFLAGIMAASAALAYLLTRIDPRALRLYALLGTLLAAWMLLIHVLPRQLPGEGRRLPKELAVGIFFPAAVFIPTVARAPWLQRGLLPTAALLAAVCTLNCLFVYAWEHPSGSAAAHWTTRWAVRHLPQLAAAVLLLSVLVSLFSRPILQEATRLPALACALSAALLLLLHTQRLRLSTIHLRACADAALLTPLLFFLHLP